MKLNTEKCLQWAKERGLLGENPKTDKQLEKLSSEANEMNDELNKGNLKEAFMEFGDVLVTMIIYCAQSHINFNAITANQTENKRNGLDLIAAIGDAARLENTTALDNQTEEGIISITQMADIFGEIYDICCNLAFYFDPQKALDAAVEKISNRKTVMINGTAVKEDDFTDKDKTRFMP